jgi:sec-independent protein translocase protein TatA
VHLSSPAEIFGVDGIIILIVVVLVLFGSTQIPKLARSLGSAQKEFKQGQEGGGSKEDAGTKPVLLVSAPVAETTPAHATLTVEAPGARPSGSTS